MTVHDVRFRSIMRNNTDRIWDVLIELNLSVALLCRDRYFARECVCDALKTKGTSNRPKLFLSSFGGQRSIQLSYGRLR
jgi:hypothetical protein